MGPARYPAPEHAFVGYPTRWLQDDDLFQSTVGADGRLATLVATPLFNYVATTRVTDLPLLRAVLAAARDARRLRELEEVLTRAGVGMVTRRATLAWMLKYDLLRAISGSSGECAF